MKSSQSGSSSVLVFFVISVLTISIASLSLFVTATSRYVHSVENKNEHTKELYAILNTISDSMQELCLDKTHSPFSQTIVEMENEFSQFAFSIKDVSTAIHTLFTDKTLQNHPSIMELIQKDNDVYTTDYAWASVYIEQNMGIDVGFPISNALAQFNIHYASEELLIALLTAYEVEKAEEKAKALWHRASQDELLALSVHEILDVEDDALITKIIGTQTTFWNVQFTHNSTTVDAIFAGIPKSEEEDSVIGEYIAIEVDFTDEA